MCKVNSYFPDRTLFLVKNNFFKVLRVDIATNVTSLAVFQDQAYLQTSQAIPMNLFTFNKENADTQIMYV